jgi:hypothetical protein
MDKSDYVALMCVFGGILYLGIVVLVAAKL